MSPTQAALSLANKIAFNPDKARSSCGQNYHEFARDIDRHLSFISDRIYDYRFKPATLLEKRVKNKIRKLYISNWRDRIVEMWLNKALNKALISSLSRHSYAYRSDGVGLLDCQEDAISAVKRNRYFIKRDIKSFYYTIDQDLMIEALKRHVDEKDALFRLLTQRIKFQYYDRDRRIIDCPLGLPFGSAIACTLANIYLDDIDKIFEKKPVSYFRYADDFFICSNDPLVLKACSNELNRLIVDKKLEFGEKKSKDYSFDEFQGFELVNRLSYLGVEYWSNGIIRLPIEKRRKIINIIKSVISSKVYALNKIRSPKGRARLLCEEITKCLKSRIRNAAIIDYFLAYVEDESQLESMDRQISELIIAACTGRKFRLAHYKIVPYAFLRKNGLMSLLHRSRLLRSKEIKFSFLALFNRLTLDRLLKSIDRRRARIEQIKLARAAKKAK